MTSPHRARLVIRFGGGVRVVSTMQDLAKLVAEWPSGDRGIVYGFATRAVEAALAGKATEKDAMAAVELLCERSGLVVRR